VVSIIRANYVSTVSFTNGTCKFTPVNIITRTNSPPGQNAFGAMWSVVETYLAIVCACLPTLRPLYEKAFGKNGSTTNGSSGGRIIYPLSGRSGISWNRFKMNMFESKSADADKDSIDQSIHTAASERSFTRAEDNV
jgi:hypothetical protein